MGTTGHPVGYFELNTTDKLKKWLTDYYTWDKYEVIDCQKGTKSSNYWLAMRERETGSVMALHVIVSNRAKREGMLYTKEGDETVGPWATDIPKKLWNLLTPLSDKDKQGYAGEWRNKVSTEKGWLVNA